MIGIGLDAVTEELFAEHPHRRSGRWPQVGEVLGGRDRRPRDLRALEGQRAHAWSGSVRSDSDLVSLFVALRDRQIFSYLFCFNPEPGTRMAAHPQPSLRRWRRVQLARHLIEAEGYGLEQFGFDGDGGDGPLCGRPARPSRRSWRTATAFMTDGCPGESGEPGCTQALTARTGPASRSVTTRLSPAASDLEEIRQQLSLEDLVG